MRDGKVARRSPFNVAGLSRNVLEWPTVVLRTTSGYSAQRVNSRNHFSRSRSNLHDSHPCKDQCNAGSHCEEEMMCLAATNSTLQYGALSAETVVDADDITVPSAPHSDNTNVVDVSNSG